MVLGFVALPWSVAVEVKFFMATRGKWIRRSTATDQERSTNPITMKNFCAGVIPFLLNGVELGGG